MSLSSVAGILDGYGGWHTVVAPRKSLRHHVRPGMPGRPGVARASRIRFSSARAIGGRPRRFPSLLARASPARTRS